MIGDHLAAKRGEALVVLGWLAGRNQSWGFEEIRGLNNSFQSHQHPNQRSAKGVLRSGYADVLQAVEEGEESDGILKVARPRPVPYAGCGVG